MAISVGAREPDARGDEERRAAVGHEADVHEGQQEVGRLGGDDEVASASASESPMPTAGPLTAASTGLGMVRIVVMIGW